MAVLPGCSPARLAEAARVLDDIDAGSGPSQLKEQTPPPRREAVSYGAYGSGNGSGAFGGDLYSSTEPGLAWMVLVPGVARKGKDDPRLVAFATT
ncbi:MAG: RNA methyltransferase, partial [Alphaproteobacteria bacterium]|nr:RNA methyltransferase [Alphaproteobacteria bacterium]